MISNVWLEQRKLAWDRLESLIHQAEKYRLKNLSAAELSELGLLYRQSASDLSALRSEPSGKVMAEYLNRLVSRAHHFVYAGKKTTLAGMFRFFTHEYPLIFRRLFRYTLAAFLIFLAGTALGALVTALRPQYGRNFVGPLMMQSIEKHQMWTDSIVSVKPQASAGIMTNNLTVTFLAFAGGILAGLGTVWLLFQNGLMMGVISTLCGQYHMALRLWGFVAAHGALELPAIFIAGGAGLRIASGILFPGLLSRKEALAFAGSEAVKLLAGTIPMLIVAGTLEGFLSPSKAPFAIKLGVSLTLMALLWFWLGWDRNNEKPREEIVDAEPFLA